MKNNIKTICSVMGEPTVFEVFEQKAEARTDRPFYSLKIDESNYNKCEGLILQLMDCKDQKYVYWTNYHDLTYMNQKYLQSVCEYIFDDDRKLFTSWEFCYLHDIYVFDMGIELYYKRYKDNNSIDIQEILNSKFYAKMTSWLTEKREFEVERNKPAKTSSNKFWSENEENEKVKEEKQEKAKFEMEEIGHQMYLDHLKNQFPENTEESHQVDIEIPSDFFKHTKILPKESLDKTQIIDFMIQENIAKGKTEQAACGIIVNYNNSILLVKQIKTDYNDESWTLPGGGISLDECFEDGYKTWGLKDIGLNLKVDELIGTLDLYDYFSVDILQYNIVSYFKEKPAIIIDQTRYLEYEFVEIDKIKELYLQKPISEATFQSLLPLLIV